MSVPRNSNDSFEFVKIGTCDLSDQTKVWLELWNELNSKEVKKKKNRRKRLVNFIKERFIK